MSAICDADIGFSSTGGPPYLALRYQSRSCRGTTRPIHVRRRLGGSVCTATTPPGLSTRTADKFDREFLVDVVGQIQREGYSVS